MSRDRRDIEGNVGFLRVEMEEDFIEYPRFANTVRGWYNWLCPVPHFTPGTFKPSIRSYCDGVSISSLALAVL